MNSPRADLHCLRNLSPIATAQATATSSYHRSRTARPGLFCVNPPPPLRRQLSEVVRRHAPPLCASSAFMRGPCLMPAVLVCICDIRVTPPDASVAAVFCAGDVEAGYAGCPRVAPPLLFIPTLLLS